MKKYLLSPIVGSIVGLTVFLICVCVQQAYAKNALKEMKAQKSGPIHIVSDRLEAFNEKRMVVFSGNVVATESDKVIYSDRLLIFYKKDDKTPRKNPGVDVGAGDLEKIEAEGNVRITQGKRIVTGDNAVYLNDEQKIIVTGNPVMKDGANTVKGDKIIVLLDEDRGIVESTGAGRVSAVLYPEDKNKKKE
jgi:lipopolysaccharide export system protein LptA